MVVIKEIFSPILNWSSFVKGSIFISFYLIKNSPLSLSRLSIFIIANKECIITEKIDMLNFLAQPLKYLISSDPYVKEWVIIISSKWHRISCKSSLSNVQYGIIIMCYCALKTYFFISPLLRIVGSCEDVRCSFSLFEHLSLF